MEERESEEAGIPHPSEVMAAVRALAPELCKKLDTITAFQEYVWGDEDLKEIKVHPRQEQFAKLCCGPPPRLISGDVSCSPPFILRILHNMPEYEMHLIYKDGNVEIIKLD